MSLSAHDRQALSSIEDELNESDPGLAHLLDGFSKLMADEEMPPAERSAAGWRRVASGLARWLRGLAKPRRARRGPSWLPTVLVLWLLLIGTVVAAIAASHIGTSGACATVVPTQCALHTTAPH